MSKFLKTTALAAVAALGMTGAVSAATFQGTIPGGTAVNDGLVPVYGAGTTERDGWYGGQLWLFGTDVTLTFDFLGSEAGFNNSFWFNGNPLFATGGNTNNWCTFDCTVPLASVSVSGLSTGLLDFKFVTPVGEAVNGSNPDNTTPTVPNFFLSFDGANPKAASGTSVVLWLDDGGASGDDNHDDMVVRIRIDNGSISVIPLPAAGWLLLAGLGGLGVVARRKKS